MEGPVFICGITEILAVILNPGLDIQTEHTFPVIASARSGMYQPASDSADQ